MEKAPGLASRLVELVEPDIPATNGKWTPASEHSFLVYYKLNYIQASLSANLEANMVPTGHFGGP